MTTTRNTSPYTITYTTEAHAGRIKYRIRFTRGEQFIEEFSTKRKHEVIAVAEQWRDNLLDIGTTAENMVSIHALIAAMK